MPQRNYLIDATTLSTTAGGTTIVSGNTQAASFTLARTLVRTGIGDGEFLSGSQIWSIHYVVSAMATPYNMRLKLQRRNSSGVVQTDPDVWTATRSATGTYDDNLTCDLGTWNAGDQLALVWEHFRPSGSGNKSGTIDANGASYIDAPASANVTLALTGVSATGSAGTLSPNTSKALTGNQSAAAVGTLTPPAGTWGKGFNFRNTSGFVTDGANETHVLATDTYPTTRNGVTFGWEVTSGLDARDRDAGVDRRLAGINFKPNIDTATANFRVDLPASGDYAIRLAMGDAAGGLPQENYLQIRDTTTAVETFSPASTSASHYVDAGGVARTVSAWPNSNVSITRTFATTILRVALGGTVNTASSCIAHLQLSQQSGTPDVTLALTGVAATGAVGTLTRSFSKALAGNAASASVGTLAVRQTIIKVRDEFEDTDGTNATAHTANVGGPWVAHPASAASAFIASNRLTKDSNGGQALLMSTATVSGDGYVEAPVRMLTSISVNIGIAISVHPTDDDYVFARHNRDDSLWTIRSTVPGSTTPLGFASETLVANDERLARLERRTVAGNDQFRLLVGGATIIDWVTSNGHTGTRAGIRFGGAASSTTGYALERFEAGEFVAPSPDVTLALTGVSATTSVGSLTPSGGSTAVTVRLVQLNVQHGEGTDGVTDYARQVAYLTAGKDIVCMQERSTGATGWNAGMTAAGFNEAVYRENGHGNDGPSIWVKTSRVTVNDDFDHALSTGAIGWNGQNVDKAAVGVHVTVQGRSFYVFCTHLAWSAGADSEGSQFSAIRDAQSAELHSWIDSIRNGDPNVILAGDFNFTPTMPKNPSGLQIDSYLERYSDLWEQGIAEGKATANWVDMDGNGVADMPVHYTDSGTHDTRRRIDYIFLHYGAAITLNWIDMPDPRTPCSVALTGSPLFCPDVASDQRWGTPDDYGKKISDHNPVEAELTLSSDVTISLTGVSATATAGSLADSRSVALPGLAATGSTGALLSTRTKSVSGVSVSATTGTLSSSRTTILAGASTTVSAGNLAVSRSLALSGSLATAAVGSVAVVGDSSVTLALSGVTATTSAGSFSPVLSKTLTGNLVTGAAGAVLPNTSRTLTGSSSAVLVGTVSAQRSVQLTSVAGTAGTGALVKSLNVLLTSTGATGWVGAVSVLGDDALSVSKNVSSAILFTTHVAQATLFTVDARTAELTTEDMNESSLG